MAYLAAVLGKEADAQFTPVTDDLRHLKRFMAASAPEGAVEQELSALRLEILDDLLPTPSRPLDAKEIRAFKDKYGAHLASFRRRVEQEVIALAGLREPTLRARRLTLFREEARDEITEIQARMKEAGWSKVLLSRLCAVVPAIPGASVLVGLGAAVISAFGPHPRELLPSPFLYAAAARRHLID
jgi:hypothetical protein